MKQRFLRGGRIQTDRLALEVDDQIIAQVRGTAAANETLGTIRDDLDNTPVSAFIYALTTDGGTSPPSLVAMIDAGKIVEDSVIRCASLYSDATGGANEYRFTTTDKSAEYASRVYQPVKRSDSTNIGWLEALCPEGATAEQFGGGAAGLQLSLDAFANYEHIRRKPHRLMEADSYVFDNEDQILLSAGIHIEAQRQNDLVLYYRGSGALFSANDGAWNSEKARIAGFRIDMSDVSSLVGGKAFHFPYGFSSSEIEDMRINCRLEKEQTLIQIDGADPLDVANNAGYNNTFRRIFGFQYKHGIVGRGGTATNTRFNGNTITECVLDSNHESAETIVIGGNGNQIVGNKFNHCGTASFPGKVISFVSTNGTTESTVSNNVNGNYFDGNLATGTHHIWSDAVARNNRNIFDAYGNNGLDHSKITILNANSFPEDQRYSLFGSLGNKASITDMTQLRMATGSGFSTARQLLMQADDQFMRASGGSAIDSASLLLSGKDYSGSGGLTAGGISAAIVGPSGTFKVVTTTNGTSHTEVFEVNQGGDVSIAGDVGFYGASPVAQQTAVPVTAQGIHDALVALGLITA